MSTTIADNNNNSDNIPNICANCGKSEESGNGLKKCVACLSVKYCSKECQIAHRPQHKKECRRRAFELHDEELFKQPSQLRDCPICFQQLSVLETTGSVYKSCCGKVICSGCNHAPLYDTYGNEVDNEKCPFCRTPFSATDEEIMEREKKRVELNDPIAIYNKGMYYQGGRNGFPEDYDKALELFLRAGELGYSQAYGNIGNSYNNGRGVDFDETKAMLRLCIVVVSITDGF